MTQLLFETFIATEYAGIKATNVTSPHSICILTIEHQICTYRSVHVNRKTSQILESGPLLKSRTMKWTGYVACVGEMRSEHKILVGKPEGKRARRT